MDLNEYWEAVIILVSKAVYVREMASTTAPGRRECSSARTAAGDMAAAASVCSCQPRPFHDKPGARPPPGAPGDCTFVSSVRPSMLPYTEQLYIHQRQLHSYFKTAFIMVIIQKAKGTQPTENLTPSRVLTGSLGTRCTLERKSLELFCTAWCN